MRVSSTSATDIGRKRLANEDYLRVREDLGLFVVADGMGGHEAGEVASQTAVEGIEAFIEATVEMSPHQTWHVPFDPQQTVNRNRLRAAFCWGNRKIAKAVAASRELETSGKPSMGTTAVAVLIAGQAATVAHVGDSRAYRLRQGQLEQLTRDHSEVEARIQAGWDPNDPALDDVRHVVTRALQGEQDLKVDLQEVSLRPGDRLLLCSDGVFTVLAEDQITDVLRRETNPNLDSACQALIRGANEGGGPDNVTAIVVEVDAV
ncbi:MAG: protein phosphatase 2C domain-containing protein [Acidobacteriota bacterium]|nr:protein phosphatase 2C domain-containing protein [Acidobacteriota bacterium]